MACKTIDGIFIPGCMGTAAMGRHRCTCRDVRSQRMPDTGDIRLLIPKDSKEELMDILKALEGIDKRLAHRIIKELKKY